jgi:hypothetical protein
VEYPLGQVPTLGTAPADGAVVLELEELDARQ